MSFYRSFMPHGTVHNRQSKSNTRILFFTLAYSPYKLVSPTTYHRLIYSSSRTAKHKRHDCEDEKHDKQNPGDMRRHDFCSDQTHGAGDQRDHQEQIAAFNIGFSRFEFRNKKTDVAEHPEVFDHVGLLFNEPSSCAEVPFI